MRITIFTETIWPALEPTLEHFRITRNGLAPGMIKAGTNFSILLGSACLLEGMLESLLRGLLAYRRARFNRVEIADFDLRLAMNSFYNRLEEDLSNRIGRSIGASGYSEMFRLLVGQSLNQMELVKPLWEPAATLFQFRNVLGHGREVSARRFAGVFVEGGSQEDFSGGYRKVEDYLLKIGLSDQRFIDSSSEFLFLKGEIADHFFSVARQVPEAIVASLSGAEAEACREALDRSRREAEAGGV